MNRKLILILLSIFFSEMSALNATIWRISNNDPTADYDNVQDAVDDVFVVLEDDTLMIEGSPSSYTGAVINRRFVILGPGYLLTENPQTPISGATAIMQGALSVTAAGTKISGLVFNFSSLTGIAVRANNITITKCYFQNGGISFFNSDGCVIRQCFLNTVRKGSSLILATNISLSNSIITDGIDGDNLQYSYFENNVLTDNGLDLSATYFRNNIVFTTSTNSFSITSANLENNLFAGNQIDPNIYPTNQASVDMSQVFIQNGSTDGQYQLAAGSVAIGAGFGGTDCGIFGGQFPYVLSGLGDVPVIYDLRTEGTSNTQTGLPVSIKAKSY